MTARHAITLLTEDYIRDGSWADGTPRLTLSPTICGTCRRPVEMHVIGGRVEPFQAAFYRHVPGSQPRPVA